MTVISVAPEELETVARSMLESADEVEHCGRELLGVAAAAPSYDGQYAPWLEVMATEDDHDTRLLAEEMRVHANELLGIAGAFRDADLLDALGHGGWAVAIRRIVDAGHDPTGLTADWLGRLGRPPGINPHEWNLLTPEEKQPILEGAWNSAWLWANPASLAAALTNDREGQEYLERTALPQLSNSPTGRAVVEALLEHAPVKMVFLPGPVRDISEWVRAHTGSGLANLQLFGRLVIMYDPSQPGHIFAHEAVHLLARQAGVEPWSILGDRERPGFSLQMEREAMIVDHTIQIETPPRRFGVQELRSQLRTLAGDDASAAFQLIKRLYAPHYDSFPPGYEPPRHWRADLLALGLGPEVIQAIEDEGQFPPPPPPPR